MKAIVVTDKAAGTAGMKLVERPEPQGAALASLSGCTPRGGCKPIRSCVETVRKSQPQLRA